MKKTNTPEKAVDAERQAKTKRAKGEMRWVVQCHIHPNRYDPACSIYRMLGSGWVLAWDKEFADVNDANRYLAKCLRGYGASNYQYQMVDLAKKDE